MRELTHRVWHDFTLCELQLTHRIGDVDVPDLHALRRLFPDKGTALLPLQEIVGLTGGRGQILGGDRTETGAAARRIKFGIQNHARRHLLDRIAEVLRCLFASDQKLIALRADPYNVLRKMRKHEARVLLLPKSMQTLLCQLNRLSFQFRHDPPPAFLRVFLRVP